MPVDQLHEDTRTAREHLARADTKASLLMGLAGVAAAGGSSVIAADHLPVAAAVAAWTAVAALTGATAVLIWAVRPHLDGGWGVVRTATPGGTWEQWDDERLAGELAATSALAVTKYRLIRRSTDLMLAALGLAVAAVVLAALL